MDDWHNHHRIKRACKTLKRGGVVAYPTEAVWGLGCDPFCEQAVEHILAIKRRERRMGLILIASDIVQLGPFLEGLSDNEFLKLNDSWPGPQTWLVPNNRVAPDWITGGRTTLAVRVTAHPLASALCAEYGAPLVSTSANPHGLPPAKTALKLNSYFCGLVDDCLPGLVGKATQPTAIRDLISNKIIRSGG